MISSISSMNNSYSSYRPKPEDVFSKMDNDNSGSVTKTEMQSFFKSINQTQNSESSKAPNISELFNQIDIDGDGLITVEEDENFRTNFMPEQPADLMNQPNFNDSLKLLKKKTILCLNFKVS